LSKQFCSRAENFSKVLYDIRYSENKKNRGDAGKLHQLIHFRLTKDLKAKN